MNPPHFVLIERPGRAVDHDVGPPSNLIHERRDFGRVARHVEQLCHTAILRNGRVGGEYAGDDPPPTDNGGTVELEVDRNDRDVAYQPFATPQSKELTYRRDGTDPNRTAATLCVVEYGCGARVSPSARTNGGGAVLGAGFLLLALTTR